MLQVRFSVWWKFVLNISNRKMHWNMVKTNRTRFRKHRRPSPSRLFWACKFRTPRCIWTASPGHGEEICLVLTKKKIHTICDSSTNATIDLMSPAHRNPCVSMRLIGEYPPLSLRLNLPPRSYNYLKADTKVTGSFGLGGFVSNSDRFYVCPEPMRDKLKISFVHEICWFGINRHLKRAQDYS